MYPISEHYRSAINNSNPSYLTGSIKFKDGSIRELTMADIAIGGPSITMQAVTKDVLEFGAAVLGQLEISVITDKGESRYKYYDGVITLEFHIKTEGGVETIPLGEYIITEAEKDKTALRLSAYDNLFKLDIPFTTSMIGTPFELMTVIADDCGCRLAEGEEYYKSLPNGEQLVAISPDSSCSTYRQAASIIAQMCGAFVQADRYGKITVKQFSTSETFTLGMSQRYKSTIADYMCKYVDLSVTGLAGSFHSVSENVESGLTMYIDDAPAWDEGLDSLLQEKADNLMLYLETIQYTPSDLLIISDPSIDCGDLVTLETDNGTVQTLITSYTWKFHNQMELQSVGKNPYLMSTSASHQRIFRDIEKYGGGYSSVLHAFKNIRKFHCTQVLTPIAEIIFAATKDTFVLFNGTFQVDVEVDDIEQTTSLSMTNSNGTTSTHEVKYKRDGYVNVTIQYYYNGVPFGDPYTQTLRNGSHLITLHYPIASVVKDSINRFAVHMSTDTGDVKILSEKFIGTISGQGLVSKIKWDGTINATDVASIFEVEPNVITVNPSIDSPSISSQTPTYRAVREYVSRFEFDNNISFGNVNAIAGIGGVILTYTVETAKQAHYTFNREYVSCEEDAFGLRTTYVYNSEERPIDSGKLCEVTIRTDDKVSIESVEPM